LSDEDEINIYGTDPFDIDTDGDGVIDGTEVQYGTDPLDANDFPLLSLDARFHALVVIVCLPLAYFALRRARYSRPAP
jgi:hypothetical protein